MLWCMYLSLPPYSSLSSLPIWPRKNCLAIISHDAYHVFHSLGIPWWNHYISGFAFYYWRQPVARYASINSDRVGNSSSVQNDTDVDALLSRYRYYSRLAPHHDSNMVSFRIKWYSICLCWISGMEKVSFVSVTLYA